MTSSSKPRDPFETPPPEKDTWPDDEVSQVKTPKDAWRKLEKLDQMLNRMVEPIRQIPEIAEKVSDTAERVAKVEERLDNTKERVKELDDEVGRAHDCFQVDRIEKIDVTTLSIKRDQEEDTKKLVRTCTELENLTKEVTKIEEGQKSVKDIKRNNVYYWIGLAASFLIVAFGSVWYMRGVSADIQLEAQARQTQFIQVEKVLNKVSERTGQDGPVASEIKTLQKTVEKNGHAKIIEWCNSLTDADVEHIKSVLPRQSWPDCDRLKMQ